MSDIDDILGGKEEKPLPKAATLKFSETDVQNILEVLAWAQQTAIFMAELEEVKGTKSAGSRLKSYAVFANELIEYITKSVDAGEPDFDKIN